MSLCAITIRGWHEYNEEIRKLLKQQGNEAKSNLWTEGNQDTAFVKLAQHLCMILMLKKLRDLLYHYTRLTHYNFSIPSPNIAHASDNTSNPPL